MKINKRLIFRILFVLIIVYHIWSYLNYGFAGGTGAFSIILWDGIQANTIPFIALEILLFIVLNAINYGLHIGLPIWFFYRGWIKK